VKAIKSDSDSDSDEQKKLPVFQEKNRGVTPSVADLGVTHPIDATDRTDGCSALEVLQLRDQLAILSCYR